MSWQGGDVVFAQLGPARGTEQDGRRPVVVISAVTMGSRVIVVPLTTSLRAWPTRVEVTLHKITSEAICDQVRTITIDRLDEDLYGRIHHATLTQIRNTVARLIGVYGAGQTSSWTS